MHVPNFLLGLALFSLSLTVHGLPAAQKHQIGSFKVKRAFRPGYLLDGPASLKKAYSKFGIVPNEANFDAFEYTPVDAEVSRKAVSKASDTTENGAVSNSPVQNDIQFLSPVSIGGQQFVMNFDTGSADTWVFNTQLDKEVSKGHSIFDPAKSKTFKKMDGFVFNITYGDRSFAHGTVGTDTVDIGGATVPNQAIGLPEQVSSSFAKDQISDGLVGLAFSTLNTMEPEPQRTFFENIAENLDEPVFTAQLKHGAIGSYEFGKIDETKFSGDMVKIPVNNSRGHWEIKSTMYAIGDATDIKRISAKGAVSSAVADTGTTLMLLNDEIVEAYYEQVPGAELSYQAGGYVYPCNATLPDMFVSLHDTHLGRIPGDMIHFSLVGTDSQTGTKLCFGGLQSNHNSGIQVYGDVFFKALFIVFDLRGPSLHLAAHA